MNLIAALFLTILYVIASILIVRTLFTKFSIDTILVFFLVFTGLGILTSHALSLFSWLSNLIAWMVAGIVYVLLGWICYKKFGDLDRTSRRISTVRFRTSWSAWRIFYNSITKHERFRYTLLIATVLVVGFINGLKVVLTAPHNYDSMTYHLARVGYFLQHGSFASYPANFWAQVSHVKNSAGLLIFVHFLSGGNENLFQSVQFSSYWVIVLSCYVVSVALGMRKRTSLLSAIICGLFTEMLMEAVTTQNDLIVAAYFSISITMLVLFIRSNRNVHLILSFLALGLAFGVKVSALYALPAFLIVLLWTLRCVSIKGRMIPLLVGSTSFLLLLSLPANYVQNMLDYGNPIGPKEIQQGHSFAGRSFTVVVQEGAVNLIRYFLDFYRLDGLLPTRQTAFLNNAMQYPVLWLLNMSGIRFEKSDDRSSDDPKSSIEGSGIFSRSLPAPNEDRSQWGVLGFALAFPALLLSLLRFRRLPFKGIALFSTLSFLTFAILAMTAPYEEYRGRYFLLLVILTAPAISYLFHFISDYNKRYVSVGVNALILAGCVSALFAVSFQKGKALTSFTKSRIEQLTTRGGGKFYEPISNFEKLVPQRASVSVLLPPNVYEYPLFGRGMTRKLVPVAMKYVTDRTLSFISTDYLLYDSTIYKEQREGDMPLGANWYLRKLNNVESDS